MRDELAGGGGAGAHRLKCTREGRKMRVRCNALGAIREGVGGAKAGCRNIWSHKGRNTK